MGRHAKFKKQLLKNLNGASNSKKWREDCGQAKKELKDMTTRQNDTADELERVRDEVKVLREAYKQEQERHEATKTELQTSQETVRELEYRLERLQMEKLQTTVSLEKSLNESSEYSSQLDSANTQIECMRRESVLNAKKTGERFSEQRKCISTVSSERNRLINTVEQQEIAQAHRIPKLGKYSVLQSAHLQRKAVLQCEGFMKGGATTTSDYNHLLRKLVRKAAATGHSPFMLDPTETFVLRTVAHLSDNDLKNAKKVLQTYLGFDVLSSRSAVSDVKKVIANASNYDIELMQKTKEFPDKTKMTVDFAKITIKDLEKGLTERVKYLDKHNLLVDVDDVLTISILGDKGSEETKLCMSIENVRTPNSPNNLMLLSMYEGSDSAVELRKYAAEVFEKWDALKEIKFTNKFGVDVILKLKKKAIGDMKLLSGLMGHRGQACSHPCYICDIPWVMSGSSSLLLGKVDFSMIPTNRTLSSYASDSKSGKNGVQIDSKPLCDVEPEDYVIPTVHSISGVFDRYFENHINGELNSMDRKDKAEAMTLREHKKDLKKLENDEKIITDQFQSIVDAKEAAYCCATAYNLISQNPLSHLKTPEPLCSSSICVVNHLPKDRKFVKWVFCDTCQKYFHFECSAVFSPSIKIEIEQKSTWCCNECKKWDFQKHHREIIQCTKNLEHEVQNTFNSLKEVAKKRMDLESLLHRSTGANRKKYEMLLASIGSDLRTWYQKLGGNQIRKILRPENIDKIFEILRPSPQNNLVHKAMKGLAKIMSASNNRFYTDNEIDEIQLTVNQFLLDMKMAFPKEAITPKLHLIAYHLIPYMRKHKTWGKSSEQAIEHVHAKVNMLKRRFQPIRSLTDRARLIVEELCIGNWLHDTGVFNE
ncbi:hypothetical protein CAEBREN_21095 [Caenorhabditis brenneri]|uniref:Zinc finger PHD-type domain-containing protein n=1 Tax=Caenorhabditis brenneri TaxID=135651 RepID=G0MIT3_CAEBE|nr:hypothetical protein CAEBREN_21095 [Caenorhabditis brenneri]